MAPPKHRTSKAFTLVEIVLAAGLFTFAIMGIVFLMGVGLQSSAETQRDSALASALGSIGALVRTYDNAPPPATLYFDQAGSPVSGTDKAYFQCALVPTSSVGSLMNANLYLVKVSAPYPKDNFVGQFLISLPRR